MLSIVSTNRLIRLFQRRMLWPQLIGRSMICWRADYGAEMCTLKLCFLCLRTTMHVNDLLFPHISLLTSTDSRILPPLRHNTHHHQPPYHKSYHALVSLDSFKNPIPPNLLHRRRTSPFRGFHPTATNRCATRKESLQVE